MDIAARSKTIPGNKKLTDPKLKQGVGAKYILSSMVMNKLLASTAPRDWCLINPHKLPTEAISVLASLR